MTSGEDWANESTSVVKEEGDSESALVDVETHEDLPDMKKETDDGYDSQTMQQPTPMKPRAPPELRHWFKHFKAHILASISRNVKSTPFREPVDAVALGIYPYYFQVIKKPMDLGTVRDNIDNGLYATKEEAIADLMLVWDNAMTFNQPDHVIHKVAAELKAQCVSKLDKLERDGIPPRQTPKPIPAVQLKRENLVRRDARKKSFDLPGEISTPQHLEQKYVSKLSSSLKACDAILKSLLTHKLHRDYVEPFIHIERKVESDAYQPMSLSKIQQRMRSLQYLHPMEFADDMRRIVTETYRYCHPEDPLYEAAAKLQQEFEMLFARINFQDNELIPPILAASSSQLSEDDEYISKLLSAQNFMVQIQTDLTQLIRDYMQMKRKNKKNKSNKKKRVHSMTPATPLTAAGSSFSTPVSRGGGLPVQGQLITRPSTSGKGPAAKRPRTDSATMVTAPRSVLTLQEANDLKDEISRLEPEHQFKILEILSKNRENLVPDENGEVEIEIVSCSAKSVADIKAYIAQIRRDQVAAKQRKNLLRVTQPPSVKPSAAAGPSTKPDRGSRLSDSSSDNDSSSDSSSDDSSSNDSSSDSE